MRGNSAMMAEIARESSQQAQAIDEINVAVRQMDEMTQHNAALVEETNAAIEQTEARANELDTIVDVFHIAQGVHIIEKPQPRRAAPVVKAKSAQTQYASQGNAAVSADWDEF